MAGNHPQGTVWLRRCSTDLGQGHKAQIGIARSHKLMGLVDVFTLHPFFFQSCAQAHALHHLHGGGTIRCQLGIGARNALKRRFAQHIALPIHHLGVCAPQHQLTHSIGE